MATEQSPKPNKCYSAHTDIAKLMDGLYNIELERINVEKELKTKRITKKEAKEKKKALNKRKRPWQTAKVRLLDDIIFPSMANLTVFLEFLQHNSYLGKTFEKDLKALFFAKSVVENPTQTQREKTIFERLITASCIPELKGDGTAEDISFPDFRSILCNMMQDSIFYATQVVGTHMFHERFNDLTFSSNMMVPDIGRARSWTTVLAGEAYKDLDKSFDRKKRPPLF
jgi:hypothetical protein